MLYHGDCLDIMKDIPDKSVDMILCDLPYGTLDKKMCSWDNIIPFEPLWNHYERIIKDNGAIVLFATQPFTAFLISSNLNLFKYSIIWKKERLTNIFQVKKQFGKIHEDICIFYKKQPTYYPIMEDRKFNTIGVGDLGESRTHSNQKYQYSKDYDKTKVYPTSILSFNRDSLKSSLHPTQKPVQLLEYLIKTYTNENYLVLDNCMGSGSTGVACKYTNRKFIGIEKELNYFNIAKKRIDSINIINNFI